jgi:hypothetical protein
MVGPVIVPAESVPDERSLTCVMSHVTRSGEWILPHLLRVFTLMGESEIDLTHVRLAPGTSEIEVRAVMGEVKIIVPHNLRVECDGHPLLGEFRMKRVVNTTPSPEAPLLRITGTALMAAVKIKVIDPAAPGWIDRWRQRALEEG